MIVKMKKITLVCLDRQREEALEALRSLSIMHVSVPNGVDTPDVSAVSKRIAEAERAGNALLDCKSSGKTSSCGGEEAVNQINTALDGISAAGKVLDSLEKDREKLEPWGDFNPAQVEELSRSGVEVLFCTAPVAQMPELPENVASTMISQGKTTAYFMVTAQKGTDLSGLNPVSLPGKSLSAIMDEIKKQHEIIEKLKNQIASMVSCRDAIADYRKSLMEQYEFSVTRDSMTEAGTAAYLGGYVPVTAMDALVKAAHENGWALLMEEPASDDESVPTLIQKPKWLNIMDPLFDFIGVSPGYRENDVNVFFLIFFPIFFGLIIGDAAYGTLFLLITLACKFIFLRGKESARLPLNLFLLLSSCSFIWGVLNGAWFGLSRDLLPGFMQGLDFLADPQKSPLANELVKKLNLITPDMSEQQLKGMWDGLPSKFMQWFCFLLAALHLTSARVFKFVLDVKENWRAWGHLGWGCLIVANFFMAANLIVFPGTFPTWAYGLYGVGLLLIVVTITFEASLNLPFAIIGSFTDVLSYIRLFAVGLAGTYIAVNFNKMGVMLMDSLPGWLSVVGFIGLVIVAIFGHILNIALGFLSVLVHAIRLNTLEFSNHIEMQWGGIKFKPFSKLNKPENNNQIKE